jgi:hypothetical protein
MSAGGRSGSTEALIHATLDEHRAAATRPTPHKITPDTQLANHALEIVERIEVERESAPHGFGRRTDPTTTQREARA